MKPNKFSFYFYYFFYYSILIFLLSIPKFRLFYTVCKMLFNFNKYPNIFAIHFPIVTNIDICLCAYEWFMNTNCCIIFS